MRLKTEVSRTALAFIGGMAMGGAYVQVAAWLGGYSLPGGDGMPRWMLSIIPAIAVLGVTLAGAACLEWWKLRVGLIYAIGAFIGLYVVVYKNNPDWLHGLLQPELLINLLLAFAAAWVTGRFFWWCRRPHA